MVRPSRSTTRGPRRDPVPVGDLWAERRPTLHSLEPLLALADRDDGNGLGDLRYPVERRGTTRRVTNGDAQ
ncbi:hypothetical protein [Kineococcus sp. R86509]|uniref:hypothetical protein n=1 Tax=Kineococcus sp. R86509 TaxID=3093851 RepID=UPI0036D29065